MKRVYLDNAATTPVAPEVVDAMIPCLRDMFGNPSSTHSYGRAVRATIEKARKNIAAFIGAEPAEIIFTSGGTEADNMAINCAVKDLGVTRIISSPIEHHAVLHTVEHICDNKVKSEFVELNEHGEVILESLEVLLKASDEKTLVTLMHANNEIGAVIPLKEVGALCKQYGAYFHSDTVQTMGHLPLNLAEVPVDFITCAAHKFHGPKGVGFLYVRKGIPFHALIKGGAQERERRGGTENVPGIVGLEKAMELAFPEMEEHRAYVLGLKMYMKERLQEAIPGVDFNGRCSENCLYTVLNVNFPEHQNGDMLLFTLDLKGVAASGGSACSSGSNKGSHVINALSPKNQNGPNIRFSFSRYTTKECVDYALEQVIEFYK
ncbi:cysteine desulfurase family protein [Luteibaculum oceani]|uniref:cysteine desulfurase n=1 Tax=Luteibaculum oceani TaxID=1294296 RepID=A0A5C6UUM9_9FLAO|nr:cysteine desulfurase family protein [Luteibaculum oceani]TXC77082.1 cysteine desulfurase [Luteibaculum oceani]